MPEDSADRIDLLNPAPAIDVARGEAAPALIKAFFGALPGLMAAIRAGLDARDPDATASAAHGLKGCAASLGMGRLAALCQEMEHLARGGVLETASDLLATMQEHLAVLAAHARKTWGLDVAT